MMPSYAPQHYAPSLYAPQPYVPPPPPYYRQEPIMRVNLEPVNVPISNHPVGFYCFYCACQDCRVFFSTEPIRVEPRPVLPPPSYAYLGFINNMRIAAEKREEKRLEKIQRSIRDERERQREIFAAMHALGLPKKASKALKDKTKPKGLGKSMKRRPQ